MSQFGLPYSNDNVLEERNKLTPIESGLNMMLVDA